ncbi:PREDICTED: WAT1-related protein At1g01070-like [Tarenaya hassleriana]|uniref:WAT1-related protein At1g01070-like n=1 Tax=Tarenaya hassleriana TaxID=28532 RepID=UPI00053C4ED9|nr:PREDICTED: WAT1-related protein At1g01070-like [Tarenaya hassleriana]
MGERVKCDEHGVVLVIVLSNMGMGLGNVVMRKALDGGINHMVIATYRLAVSALFLSPFALLFERKSRPKLTLTVLCQHFLSGLLGATLVQYFGLLGLTYTSATVTCALFSILPAFTFILALLSRIETLDLKSKAGIAKVVGTHVCISGALLLTFYKGLPISNLRSESEVNGTDSHPMKNKAHNKWLLGCLFNIVADIVLSLWMLFQTKITVTFPCKYSSTVLMSIFATFQCALLSLIETRDIKGWILRDKFDIFAVIYAGVVGQGIATVATTWCIKKRGPLFTSLFTPVMLMSASLFDVVILRRQMYLSSIIGSGIVVVGLYVYLWGQFQDPKDVPSEPTGKLEPPEPINHGSVQLFIE